MDIEQNGIQRHHNHNHMVGTPLNRRTGISKCICQCLSLTRFLPFVMISALFIWGIYVYLYYVIFQGYQSILLRIVLILFFMPLYILSAWSYIRTVFTENQRITEEYSLLNLPLSLDFQMSDDEINNHLENVIITRNLPIYTRSFGGYVRYCRKCMIVKPDRCHHCSTCGICIRKMDHHWKFNLILLSQSFN